MPVADAGAWQRVFITSDAWAGLSSFSETDDGGRLLITLTGLIRFDIVDSERDPRHGYRRVHGDFSPYAVRILVLPPPAGPNRAGES